MSAARRDRSLRAALACALLFALLGVRLPAAAQVALDQFEPAALAADGFALARPIVLAPRGFALAVTGDYANDPLVYQLERGERRRQAVVKDQLVLHLSAALAVHRRVSLFARLPIHALMHGDEVLAIDDVEPDGAGIGDLALGARIALLGGALSTFALGAELIARVPTARLAAAGQRYSGDEIGSYEGALIPELRFGRFDVRARLGARLRKPVAMQNLELGHALLFGIGARLALGSALSLHLELFGSTHVQRAFERRHSPLELLLGAKYSGAWWWCGAAAGPGLVEGYGSPDLRVIGSFGIGRGERGPEPRTAPTAAVRVEDEDADRDGVAGPADRCPDQPEDRDGTDDDDGCIDGDDDRDQVEDARDACPEQPEDLDQQDDADGCPEPDLEPSASEPPAAEGACGAPGEPCPPPLAAEQGDERIEFGRVEFAPGADTSLPGSLPTLRAVRSILTVNTQIVRTRIEGHADDTGDAAYNQQLSKRRARMVARWLLARGIARERLELFGCGQRYPLELAEQPTRPGRQQQRRVEFHVVEPAPARPLARPDCEPVPLD